VKAKHNGMTVIKITPMILKNVNNIPVVKCDLKINPVNILFFIHCCIFVYWLRSVEHNSFMTIL